MIRISLKSASALAFILILIMAVSISCANKGNYSSDSRGRVLDRKPMEDPPNYRQLASSLEYYEKQLGIKFFKNSKNRYQPYSTAGWQSFSIADDLNECLYDINMKGLVTYRAAGGKTMSMIEMDIARGPCGIKYPDADSSAQDRITLMEGSVVTPALDEQVNGRVSLLRGANFLQKILALPWRVDSIEGGLEQAVAKVSYEVKNPLDVTYGDVVFFTEFYGERNVGVYIDYGHLVYNSCFRAKVAKMDSRSMDYRIYRIYTGPNAIQYKVHQGVVIQKFIGSPE